MEFSSALDLDEVDLNSLLLSHAGDSDSDEEDRHRRTVDEIILNHSSSSSPSPPSSPSLPLHAGGENNASAAPSDRRLSHSHSTPLVDSDNYKFDSAINNSRLNYAGRVLPPLLGNGAARSNAKPGAALAAAAAASRSIPTPHATAIKLRRASTVAAALQKSLSETAEDDDSANSSPSAAPSDVHLSQSQEEGNQLPLGNTYSGSTISVDDGDDDRDCGVYSPENRQLHKSDEEATLDASYEIQSVNASNIENEKDQSHVIELPSSPSLGEKNEECPETSTGDESGGNKEMVLLPDSSSVDHDIIGEEEASGFGNTVSGDGDDTSVHNDDATELLEDFMSPEDGEDENSNLQQKSDSSLKPLDLAEEIEKRQAFTGLHYEEGAAAQPMRLEGVKRASAVLGYFDVRSDNIITETISSQAFRRDHGSPQVLAVHLSYIAVGMSKGSIFIVPSKYTAHQVDNMDSKMTPLALQGDRSHVPVTSMCFNLQGDMLFAGYGDGHYTVWDVQKASALKVITEHRAPVVHMLYMGQDTQVTRQFNVVSGDSKGVFKLINFKVVPWLNRISYTKSKKLLDETTSRVVCASPLIYHEGHGGAMLSSQSSTAVSNSSISGMMSGMVDEGVVIFITHQSALVAKVIPDVEVYAQIPKPDGIREGSMPYAAWRCMSQSFNSSEDAPVESSDKASLLAIAWDRKVQVAKLEKSELKVLGNWTLESAAVGLAWLGDQMLAILTSTAHLRLYAKDGNLIHQTSFSVDGFRGDNLISHHIYFTNSFGNPEKAYHSSIAVRGATIYILGQDHLIVSRLLSWKERIEVLRKAGDWIGALNMAMALYDGKSHGLVDLPKNLDDLQRIVMPYLAELLQAYVSEVFSYLSVASYNQNTKPDQSNETKEQYIRVGGVAVEFCVHIKRTDILFDEIVTKFDEAHQKETFLELLEPYILKDMLGSLPPGIMQALVEHYSKRGWLQRIEQCVLHMDILSLDFNQVVRLCREHRLDCALIYLFNKGLDDFRTPLEELLLVLRNSTGENATSLGYRVLVYLKYCFQGLAFPPGHGNLSPMRVSALRNELLDFLLEDTSAPNAWAITRLSSTGAYANVLHLLELDTEATLQVLKLGFADIEFHKPDPPEESIKINTQSAKSEKLVQRAMDILASVLDAVKFRSDSAVCSTDINLAEIWPSEKDVGYMYDFIAYYVAYGQATVSKDVLSQILQYLTSEVNISDTQSDKMADIFRRREKQLLSLIQVVPQTQWDAAHLLHLSERVQFHQVCGYIHAISHQYVAALDSYIKATQEPVHAFSFIYDMLRQFDNEERDVFESAVISRIPDLLKLSREGTYFLITDHFSGRIPFIFSELQSHPEGLFLYLKTAIEFQTTGTLDISSLQNIDTVDVPSEGKAQLQQAYLEAISTSLKLLNNNRVNVTDELMELYFELLCQFDRESVLKFLETSESYRVEQCLRLCQEYKITDAAAFLLERVGEVGGALHLILSNLSEKFAMLGAEIQKASSGSVVDSLNALMKKKVVAEILDVVHACIGLCQRNSPRLQPEESEGLWFQLLDSFCEPLMDSGSARVHSEMEAFKDSSTGSLSPEEQARAIKLKISKSGRYAHMTRKMFSIFIKEIVEGMIGYVRLPRIMLKLLSDNGNQEFGDLKLTILEILGRYDFERRILGTAKSLVEDDTYYTLSLLRKGASHGYAPRSLVCCICGSLLAKYSLGSSIQVYSCGHATHLHCHIQETRASLSGTLGGCPTCIPGKRAPNSGGMYTLAENLLISSSPSSVEQARSTPVLHPHDYESAENSFGSHPPRFELLHNLGKDQKLTPFESMPQLKLAPPALYHEKVKQEINISEKGSTSHVSTAELPRSKQRRDVKVKGSSMRFPLKSNIIFGKEKISRR